MPSTKAVSSKVCNQLNIIMFLSYFDKGLPLSLSTSLIVRGKFFPAFCLATLNIAAFVLAEVVGLLLGVGLDPGTASLQDGETVWETSLLMLAVAVEGVTSSLSRLNSL